MSKLNSYLSIQKNYRRHNLFSFHRQEIESEKLLIFFVDECHLIWGDVCGYVWGKTHRRIEIPIRNEKQRQTYYGAINYRTGTVILQEYPQGNRENTIKFVRYLLEQNRERKIVIIWDGVKYHCSQEFKTYLAKVNQERTEQEWLVRCIKLAPNAPEQNPIEDVWLQGKEMVRRYWNLCQSFKIIKWLFNWTINQDLFHFPKLSMYGSFS